jgi:hypothetical protein
MTTSARIAFVDESRRTNRYLLACAVLEVRHAHDIRRQLRALVEAPKRRIHFGSEPDARRRLLLARFDQLPVEVHVTTDGIAAHQREHEARARLLGALITHLQAVGVARLVIESRDGRDDDDKAVVQRTRAAAPPLVYEHATPTDEPLLWLPDAYAWAVGRGPEWSNLLANTLRA